MLTQKKKVCGGRGGRPNSNFISSHILSHPDTCTMRGWSYNTRAPNGKAGVWGCAQLCHLQHGDRIGLRCFQFWTELPVSVLFSRFPPGANLLQQTSVKTSTKATFSAASPCTVSESTGKAKQKKRATVLVQNWHPQPEKKEKEKHRVRHSISTSAGFWGAEGLWWRQGSWHFAKEEFNFILA